MNIKAKLLIESILLALYTVVYILIKDSLMINLLLCIVSIIFIRNIVVSLRNYKENVIFLSFNLLIFLFLLSRPIISYFFIGSDWWELDKSSNMTALFLIGLSMKSLYIGKLIAERPLASKKKEMVAVVNEKLLVIAFVLFGFFRYIVEIDRYLSLNGRVYTELYTGYHQNIPAVISSLSQMFIYFFIFYLATLPNKKNTYLAIIFYMGSVLPSVLLGERSMFSLVVVFTLIYIIIRNKFNPEENWFNRRKMLFMLGVVIALIFILSVIAENRDVRIERTEFSLNPLINFVYFQGTSFNTVVQGVYYAADIRALADINYTFGTVIDKIKYSLFSQYLFGLPSLEPANGMLNATISNNSSHKLSRLALGDWSYLAGHGRGTSYIVDNYLDFGYIGVIIFSILLGYVLNRTFVRRSSNFITLGFALLFVFNVLMLPRLNYSFAINYLVDFKFYIVLAIILLISKIKFKKNNGES